MTPKEALESIKKLIGKFSEQAPVEQPVEDQQHEMQNGKLADGTVCAYSALEPGGQFQITSAEGALVPAPTGSYELEDGSVINVVEPGVIAEVTPKAGDEAQNTEALAEIAKLKETVAELAASNAALIASNKTLIESFNAHLKMQKEFAASVGAFCEAVGSEPSDEPADTPKNTTMGGLFAKSNKPKRNFLQK